MTLRGKTAAEMCPGICLHASFLSDVLDVVCSLTSVCLANLKWKTHAIKIKRKNCHFFIKVLWGWEQKNEKVMGQTPLYEWTFRRIILYGFLRLCMQLSDFSLYFRLSWLWYATTYRILNFGCEIASWWHHTKKDTCKRHPPKARKGWRRRR